MFDVRRINRYIMECKFVSGCIAATLGPELIDTLWNVNFADGSVHGHSPLWINRYIMECKCYQTFLTPFPAEN